MKKISAILLALVMMLSMVAMADTTPNVSKETGTITVTNAVANQEYKAYRILDLELNANGAYLYVANEKWTDFVEENFTIDSDGYVTVGTENDGAELAAAAIAYAEEKNIVAEATKTCAENATSVVFDSMQVGYYLIDSSLGALCVLDTYLNNSVEITDKNDTSTPTLSKKMVGEEGEESTSIQIGETVSFQIDVEAKQGATNYVVHDEMTNGLQLNANTINVKVGSTPLTVGTDYTVITNTEDDCTFEIKFEQSYLDTIGKDGVTIVITYDATVLETAGAEGNSAWLTYGDKGTPTIPDEPKIYTSKIVINKHETGNTTKTLANAKFVLKNDAGEFYKYDETTDTVSWVAAQADATEVITDANGAATFLGLKDGTYYLVETDAPDGYNLVATPTAVTVNAKTETNGVHVVSYPTDVANSTGTELPSTGGMGTTLFYVVGGLMMAAAVVLLVSKKKVNA